MEETVAEDIFLDFIFAVLHQNCKNQPQKQILPKNPSLLYCENNFHDFNKRFHKHDFINILLSFQLIFFLLVVLSYFGGIPIPRKIKLTAFFIVSSKILRDKSLEKIL